MTRIIPCPTCRKDVEWSEQQKWRPFCSERCKLIDLGEWASESMRIAGESAEPWDGSDNGMTRLGSNPEDY